MGSFGLWTTKCTQSTLISAKNDEDPGRAVHGTRGGVGLVMEVAERSGNIFSDLLPTVPTVPNTAAWNSFLCIVSPVSPT